MPLLIDPEGAFLFPGEKGIGMDMDRDMSEGDRGMPKVGERAYLISSSDTGRKGFSPQGAEGEPRG